MRVKLGSNQTEVEQNGKTLFFSYETLVALFISGKGFYRTSKRFSSTTTKHVNKWLGGATAREVSQEELERLAEN